MRQVSLKQLQEKVREVVQKANFEIDAVLRDYFGKCLRQEESESGKEIFQQLLQNAEIADSEKLALCQDTGLAIFFVELGEDVEFVKDGPATLQEALELGTVAGYQEGYLRKSVCHPLTRKNTGNNTPIFTHLDIVRGDTLKVTFMAKGGGSENMSALRMMPPSAGIKGVEDFVVETVSKAGPNPCPPTIVGVGIGGNFDNVALLAKKALLRSPLGAAHPEPEIAELESRILEKINKLGVGPMGLGGKFTSLAVHVEWAPCHIASFPVAVNLNCHSHRVIHFGL